MSAAKKRTRGYKNSPTAAAMSMCPLCGGGCQEVQFSGRSVSFFTPDITASDLIPVSRTTVLPPQTSWSPSFLRFVVLGRRFSVLTKPALSINRNKNTHTLRRQFPGVGKTERQRMETTKSNKNNRSIRKESS